MTLLVNMEDRTMDELVSLVVQKTGIPEATARTAVDTVLGFLKQRLPAPVAAQVDASLAGSGGAGIGNIAKGLGGLAGKK
jgi:hypothetical protein